MAGEFIPMVLFVVIGYDGRFLLLESQEPSGDHGDRPEGDRQRQ